ncbi:MAG: glycosyltransferase [Bacteroidota bacterium]
MDTLPLVSVICLCYNQAKFVHESLSSVLEQDYKNIELIIVDDASTDNSQEVINRFLVEHANILFIPLEKNKGNCTAFNRGLFHANGKYVIDLAADDVLLPNRISKQVNSFEKLSLNYGVIFSDALMIDQYGKGLKTFYKRDKDGKLIKEVPSGNIYQALIEKMVVCSPTMMIRKAVLDELGGYDESLSYEDYDFWVRSSRSYHYFFLDEILTKKRILPNSQSQQFYKIKNNKHLASTLEVCQKAKNLNQNESENNALAISVRYHLKLSVLTENFKLALDYFNFLVSFQSPTIQDWLLFRLTKMQMKVGAFYKLYLKYVRGFNF